jgi:phage tail-like protein
MAGFANFDSAGTHKFGFTLDGIESRMIKSVDGLSLKLDKVETKTVTMTGKPVHKVWAGNRVFIGQMSVTRMMTEDVTWDVWFNMAVKSVPTARKNGVVTIYHPSEPDVPVREYIFKNAWPIELKISGMNATSSAPIEETVTFVYEELEAVTA